MLDRGIDIRMLVCARSEHVGDNFFARECRKGEGPDELLGGVGHDDLYPDATVLQQANNFRRLICRNSATDAESDFHNCRLSISNCQFSLSFSQWPLTIANWNELLLPQRFVEHLAGHFDL